MRNRATVWPEEFAARRRSPEATVASTRPQDAIPCQDIGKCQDSGSRLLFFSIVCDGGPIATVTRNASAHSDRACRRTRPWASPSFRQGPLGVPAIRRSRRLAEGVFG